MGKVLHPNPKNCHSCAVLSLEQYENWAFTAAGPLHWSQPLNQENITVQLQAPVSFPPGYSQPLPVPQTTKCRSQTAHPVPKRSHNGLRSRDPDAEALIRHHTSASLNPSNLLPDSADGILVIRLQMPESILRRRCPARPRPAIVRCLWRVYPVHSRGIAYVEG